MRYRRWQIFVPLLVLTLAVMAVLNVVDGPLKSGVAPQGSVSYELAGSVERKKPGFSEKTWFLVSITSAQLAGAPASRGCR